MTQVLERARLLACEVETALEAIAAERRRMAKFFRGADDDVVDVYEQEASELRGCAMLLHDAIGLIASEEERLRPPTSREMPRLPPRRRLRLIFGGGV